MDKQTIEYLKTTYPEIITKDQFYRICHISKKTASYYLDYGFIPCINSGKKTRKYTIRLYDVIAFIEKREKNPEDFKAPDNYYKSGNHNPKAVNIVRLSKSKDILWLFLKEKFNDYDDVISLSKASEITGYSTKTVWEWCKKGKLKSFNIFNRVKIPKEYLIDFFVSEYGLLIAKKSKKHTDILHDAMQYISDMRFY